MKPRTRSVYTVPFRFKQAGRCVWCGKTIPPRAIRWCSRDCLLDFRREAGHVRKFALKRNRKANGYLRCDCCRVRIYGQTNAEVDHINPLALGGTHAPENLQVLCELCHSEKTLGDVRDIARVRGAGID